jgi:hypothetical protein
LKFLEIDLFLSGEGIKESITIDFSAVKNKIPIKMILCQHFTDPIFFGSKERIGCT